MSVPTFEKFIEPILRFLASRPEGAPARDVYEGAAGLLNISDLDRQELLPSGNQQVYKNRAGWAHDRLKRAGLSASPRRGYWQLTQKGTEFARIHPSPLRPEELEELTFDFNEVLLAGRTKTIPSDNGAPSVSSASSVASPDDRLSQAFFELQDAVAAELEEALATVSPVFFETIVLDVLHRLGYGASRSDLRRVGGTSDGGIDGIISLDKLGLEKVYVQAKRWQQTVGRPEIHSFYGALAGQRAAKGIFITTSAFTAHAVEYAGSVDRIIVLVDGRKLAQLMIEHEVGVTSRTLRIPKLDRDYFDEE